MGDARFFLHLGCSCINFTCKKQGHQAHQCRSNNNKTLTTSRFEGYYYTCQKYGRKSQDCRSKEKNNWTRKGQDKEPKKSDTINWDCNTWVNFEYYGKYRHIVADCARIHL